MSERWDRDQVLGLAPDSGSARAAATVARPGRWTAVGCIMESAHGAVWGECQGSGSSVYRTCADLSGPAFHCSCPSRKFPCKHALALLLLWSDGVVPAAAPPGWVAGWLRSRAERTQGTTTAQAQGTTTAQATSAEAMAARARTAERRERRVEDGIDELGRWLHDQITGGLAQAEKAPYRLWDDAARRLVDAQASGLAGQVRSLAALPRRAGVGPDRGDEPDWPQRLLEEYALLRLLTVAYRRRAELPESLRATVRSRVGFTVGQEEVLTGVAGRVRDQWYIAGSRDTEQERLITRRVWLRGGRTGRPALILSFAGPGRPLDTSLVAGGTIDAELAFYPGAQPLRALVAERHGPPFLRPPAGASVRGLLQEFADALARDPWLDRWPAVLSGVRLGRDAGGAGAGWQVVDQDGDALPVRTADPWRLLAVSGGRPVTVAGEWTPYGLRPLSAWHDEEGIVVL